MALGPWQMLLRPAPLRRAAILLAIVACTAVVSSAPVASLGPVNMWIGLTNSDDVGIRFDLRAEVYRLGTLVGSGELASVVGGSSGFNNAYQRTIPMTAVAGATLSAGDVLTFRLLVRNACVGSGKNSGRMRLWFNDAAANSRFETNAGGPAIYYLRSPVLLATTSGAGPRASVDTQAGARCSAYKTVATWIGLGAAPGPTPPPRTTFFGPTRYTRQPGAANTYTASVTVPAGVTAPFTLHVQNGLPNGDNRLASGAVRINGTQYLGNADFASHVGALERTVALTSPSTLQVVLQNPVGAHIDVSLSGATSGTDTTPPTITATAAPPANANGWNNTPVVVTFTCNDSGSGIATCPPPVTVSAEAQGQVVSGTAVDAAGNSASTSVTLNIDVTPPLVAAAAAPSANPEGWNNSDVEVAFSCSDSLSTIDNCPAPLLITSEGADQVIDATATDRAGNTATAGVRLSIDTTPPVIAASASPPPNEEGWNNTPVAVDFTCSDGLSGIAICPGGETVGSEGQNQVLSGTARDRAGNEAVAAASVSLDTTPPVLTVVTPESGASVFVTSVTLAGTVTDDTSGLVGVTCNGSVVSVSGSTFTCEAPLTPGANSLLASASDRAGNTRLATVGVTYIRAPVITITSPANLTYTNITPTTVSGTIDDPTATVTINSIAAPVVNGAFSLAVPLAEGPNIVTVTGTSAAGAVGSASIAASLDTTPPHVTVTSPPDNFVTSDATVSVAGNINDIVVGTVNKLQAQVTVDGIAAQVANRTFVVPNVALEPGLNTIQVVGTDRVGNAVTAQLRVVRQEITAPRIRVVAGNNQAGTSGTTLPAPLVVRLTDASQNPAPNTPVIFKVTQNDGTVTGSGAPAATVIAITDGEGEARVHWTLGGRAGAGGNTVEAYATGFEGTALFTATALAGMPDKIVVDAGNGQMGGVAQPLAKPFIAVVVDAAGNRLGGVPVTFGVTQGDGNFDGSASVTVMTDPDGRAAARLTLGALEGNGNNVVAANFPANAGSAATFMASARIPGDVAETTISGVVLDNSNVPIQGVIVRAVLTNELYSNPASVATAIAAQTDEHGQFAIEAAPVGLVKVLVDGSTAQRPGVYPSLEYDLVTVPGHDNTVGAPIYLLPLDTASHVCVTATSGGGTLTLPQVPGFSLTFGPGQVTFPGGSKTGCISVTAVNSDKVPMEPSFGQQPRFIVTIQPPDARFNPPAPITFPNVDGLRPREVTELFSYDHDIASFVAIGTGTVSSDGLVVRSDPGVGVLKAGWHGGGAPNPTGNAGTCPECKKCEGNSCVADPAQNGNGCTRADGKAGQCLNGNCVVLEVTILSADVTTDQIKVRLAPNGFSGNLVLRFTGSGTGGAAVNHQIRAATRAAGTYTETFDIPNLPVADLTSLQATWTIEGGIAQTATLGYHIKVHGDVRHSVYNTPKESECTLTPTEAVYITDIQCRFTASTMNSQFKAQLDLNGSGISDGKNGSPANGTLQVEDFCLERKDPNRPADAAGRSYRLQKAIVPACRSLTLNETTVASWKTNVDAGDTQGPIRCGGRVYVHNPAAPVTKTVTDNCPDCGPIVMTGPGPKFVRQLDNYTFRTACRPRAFTDIGNFRTIEIF